MLILLGLVAGLCTYDAINNKRVFSHLVSESEAIMININEEEINNTLIEKTENLNSYWTEKMDTLCISISRKDLQPISDYIQFLVSALYNNNLEEAKTYARLLNYNILGIQESTGFTLINIL